MSWWENVHCCMCAQPPATLVGGNLLCEEHLADAAMEAEVEAADAQESKDEPEPLRHNPFDEDCVKHLPMHPVRDVVCEICNAN